ncbi:MAG: hypothetical protein Fur0012_14760 [Elusimicrobiota bacterium]
MRKLIISGPFNWGKTSLLIRFFSALKKKGYQAGGFLAEKEFEGSSRFYSAFFSYSKERFPLVEVSGRGLIYSPCAFNEVRKRTMADISCPVLVIDEIGPLEFMGRGHARLLKYINMRYRGLLVLSCRPELSSSLAAFIGKAQLLEKPSLKELIEWTGLK